MLNYIKKLIKPIAKRLQFYNKIALKIDDLEAQLHYIRSKIGFLEKEHMQACEILDSISLEYLQKIDKEHIGKLFKARMNYDLDFENLKTFNEKIQWLKLHYRTPKMTIMSDKYRVRNYLMSKGYGKYLNKLYGVYEDIYELEKDWSHLPNKFVIKTNNDSGTILFIKEKQTFELSELHKLEMALGENYYYNLNYYLDKETYYFYRKCEWPYKDIKPLIIVEKYLEDETGSLKDYKVFCFNGKPYFIQVDVDRFTRHKRCFYDLNWVKQEFSNKYPLFEGNIAKPSNLDLMLKLSADISSGFPHLRVDWYVLNTSELIFGEITFFHESGTGLFSPEEWDLKMGELINLHL